MLRLLRLGMFHIKFTPLWPVAQECLCVFAEAYFDQFWEPVFAQLSETAQLGACLLAWDESPPSLSYRSVCVASMQHAVDQATPTIVAEMETDTDSSSASDTTVAVNVTNTTLRHIDVQSPQDRFKQAVHPPTESTDVFTLYAQLWQLLAAVPTQAERRNRDLVPLLFAVARDEYDLVFSCALFVLHRHCLLYVCDRMYVCLCTGGN